MMDDMEDHHYEMRENRGGRPFDYANDNNNDDNMYLTERAHARGRRSNLKP